MTAANVASRGQACCSVQRGSWGFHPADAFVIGDKPCDIDLGRGVGATSILVRTGYGAGHEAAGEVAAHHVADDLLAAAEFVHSSLDNLRD